MRSLLHHLAFSLLPGGCKFTADAIRVRQRGGWVTIPKDQVHAVKVRNVGRVIVRLFDGRRLVLDLFRFPIRRFDRVRDELREAQRSNERTRTRDRDVSG